MKRICDECFPIEIEAHYTRHTQFAGSHHFCAMHAKAQPDFMKSDDEYFFWEDLKECK